ncbi:MAG: hypothetical protein NC097_03175 [Clostridium sp.]|nr:hypothetical protein [Prevotella sp.]MCM1428778.1 hypothetical protein [Clostridium sp.]MCM1475153.1 hypothetical protein [Muribaculaceae bacterium]
MKKLLTFALCFLAIAGASAQKAKVDEAKKLGGKDLPAARALIKEAIFNSESANDPYTYFTAGQIEWDAYDKANNMLMIDPNSDKVDKSVMPTQLMNGYEYFMQMLPLDQQPNEKGQVKPKYTKKVLGEIESHHENFFREGANAFNAQKFYPEGYKLFMIYGDMPTMPEFSKKLANFPDSVRATSYYNAGLAAWSASQVKDAIKAFEKARKAGYDQPEAYIYEIAGWQNLAQNDSTLGDKSEQAIMEIATAGYKQFGLSQPLFINNMVNTMMNNGKDAEALALLNDLLAQHPENADLYGLRAFIYDRMGNADASEADYRKATTLDGVTYDILKVAANKLIRVGTEKWNVVDPTDRAAKTNIRDNYFKAAQELLERAKQMKPEGDGDLNYLIDTVNYALDTYFK